MHQRINKKIFIYFFLFILLTTLSNKNFINYKYPNINQINILGFNQKKNYELSKNLKFLRSENLFLLNEEKIKKILDSNNLIEKYQVFKKFPSTLEFKIYKTNYLAIINKSDQLYFIGSNNKLIKTNDNYLELPQIFGNFDIKEFIDFKNNIDNSMFSYKDIQTLYFFPSGRWDIHTNFGIIIKLPRENVKEKLNLAYSLLTDDNFKDSKQIDIRQKNQIIINE